MPQSLQEILVRARKRYSILVHSGPDGRFRQFSIPGVLVPLLAGVCLLGVLGGGAAVLNWASARGEAAYVARLESENTRLGMQLQEIRGTVERFEARMAENLEMEQAYRNLANLDAIPDDVRRLGVGGPPPLSELADEASPSEAVREARVWSSSGAPS